MKRSILICGWAIFLALLTAPHALAQTDESTPDEEETSIEEDEEAPDGEEAPEPPADAEESPEPPEPPVEPDEPAAPDDFEADEPAAPDDFEADDDFGIEESDLEEDDEEWPDDWDDEWEDDGFEDFADDIDFIALDDLDAGMFDRITPVSTFPFVEHHGQLRVRPRLRYNFDLGTRGTSAVLPPIDTFVPQDPQPQANEEADLLWNTDLRLRIAPTFHLTESLRIHTDFDFLRNVSMGADPRHHYFVAGEPSANRRVMDSSAGEPSPVHVRQAYGEIDAFFGTILAGRMLNHWGLGMFANDGNCTDCDWGDQVDRLALRTKAFDVYGLFAYDLPRSGVSPTTPGFEHGHPYQLGQLDTTNQWTVSLSRTPRTREEQARQIHQLNEEVPVVNGGVYFSRRTRDGEFPLGDQEFDVNNPTDPVYRGLSLNTTDLWVQFLWNPQPERQIRLELEALGTFGEVENATNDPVGFERGTGDTRDDINCFDDDSRDQAPQVCRTGPDGESTAQSVRQFGLAMESEFSFDGPISFGLNGGFATGGDAPNWGYGGDAGDHLEYTRFNPDYHVDLILFREVIGTVTNAYYANPYVAARFLESGMQRMELQLDAIGSRAFSTAGAPGDSPWLGLEFDASLRYIASRSFEAAIDGGILFPFGGMSAVAGEERLNYYGDLGPFSEDLSPGLAWTIQGRLSWDF